MSARSSIVDKLVNLLKEIDGTGDYNTNVYGNVTKRLLFWDEVTDFPHISVVAGSESREYKPASFKWGRLSVSLKVYVHKEDPVAALEDLLVDIERLIDSHNTIDFGAGTTQDIRLTNIETDEGLLVPYGVGEINLQILYEVPN
jgi:hypothetical protein